MDVAYCAGGRKARTARRRAARRLSCAAGAGFHRQYPRQFADLPAPAQADRARTRHVAWRLFCRRDRRVAGARSAVRAVRTGTDRLAGGRWPAGAAGTWRMPRAASPAAVSLQPDQATQRGPCGLAVGAQSHIPKDVQRTYLISERWLETTFPSWSRSSAG